MHSLTTTTAGPGATDPPDDPDEAVGVVGVRGGVGTSTLAAALDARDLGTDVARLAYGASAVLVTSPSASDTARLLPLLDQSHVRGLRPIVVAVVSDGHGRWPAGSRARLRMVRERSVVVPVPWVGRWRWTGVDDHVTAAWLDATTTIAEAVRGRSSEGVVARPHRSRRRRWRRRRTHS